VRSRIRSVDAVTTDDARTALPRGPLALRDEQSTWCVGPYAVSMSVEADARRRRIARVGVSTTVVVPRARVRLEGPPFAPASLAPPVTGILFAAIAPAGGMTVWEWWVALAPGSPFVVELPLAGPVAASALTLRVLAGAEELLSWTPSPTPTERLPA
jgi:hypothetical protein